jgi:hypothetical protein
LPGEVEPLGELGPCPDLQEPWGILYTRAIDTELVTPYRVALKETRDIAYTRAIDTELVTPYRVALRESRIHGLETRNW